MGTAIAAMHATKTLHPPAGATSLIAVIGGPKIQAMGYFYALMPVAAGALILLIVALVFNNIPQDPEVPRILALAVNRSPVLPAGRGGPGRRAPRPRCAPPGPAA